MDHSVNGVRMHWREEGTGDPVIFIHGFPFNHSVWDAQLAAVPAGWRFIAPDLRGFGNSIANDSVPYTMDLFADDIIALMDHLELQQAVLCGLSMGGYITFAANERYRQRVRALVFVATRANGDSAEARKRRHELASRARKEGAQPVVDSMLPKLLSEHTRLKHPELVAKVRAMMEQTPAETLARALEGMAERADYTDHLDNINVATMVIRGEEDELIPVGDISAIARGVRGARQEVIGLTGHLPNLEDSEVFNKLLDSFLSFLPPLLNLGDISLSF
jgi:pimeloyl-ACP methyl ester carboxylesterase